MNMPRQILTLSFAILLLGAMTPATATTYTSSWSGFIYSSEHFDLSPTSITTLDIRPGGFNPALHSVYSASLSMTFLDDWADADGAEIATILGDGIAIGSNLNFGDIHSGAFTWSGPLANLSSLADGLLGIGVVNPRPFPNDFYVTGVALTATWGDAAQPVPEPETYAMLLAGLGLLGLAARRRKQQSA